MSLNTTTGTTRRVGLHRTSSHLLKRSTGVLAQQGSISQMPAKVSTIGAKRKAPTIAMSEKSDKRLYSQRELTREQGDLSIFRLPDSSSSESESEEDRATIKPSFSKSGVGDSSSTKTSKNGKLEKESTLTERISVRSSKITKDATVKPSQSPKRKSQEDAPTSSATDMFGNLTTKKKSKTSYGYGSSNQRRVPGSSQISKPRSSQGEQCSPGFYRTC